MEEERDLNIVVVGMDIDYTEKVSKILSEQFDMYYLNSMELYRFDIHPYTLSYVLKKFGKEYFREQQEGTVKYISSFSNTVITVESGALMYQYNLDLLTKDSLIVYIRMDEHTLNKRLQNRDYFSREEYNFFCLNKRELITRDEVLMNIAEVVVDASALSEQQCLAVLTTEIKKYYGVE